MQWFCIVWSVKKNAESIYGKVVMKKKKTKNNVFIIMCNVW